jgi:outer membrane protein assembly factor BamB
MTKFRRRGKIVALGLAAFLAVVAALYQFFGLRIVLDGGGRLHLAFVESVERRAQLVEEHRVMQRTQVPSATPASLERVAAAPDQVTSGSENRTVAEPVPESRAQSSPYWTDFRGPLRDGAYREQPIHTSWPSQGLTPLWKQPIGGGYASFVVAGGQAFTIEQRGTEEVVAAYDVATGTERWTNRWSAFFQESMGGDGPRATPVWADGRVYALGATGELRVLDGVTGRLAWRKNILEDNGATNLEWGMAGAPLIVGGTVIVLPGGSDGRSVVAYDRRTGDRVWSALNDRAAYASPMRVTLFGVDQLLVFTASRLVGLSVDRGDLLWEYPWRTPYDINAAQPLVVGPNRVFISSGYDTGAAVIELVADGNRISVREIWRNNRMKNRFNSSVLHDGFVYGLDESILACVNVATGELMWKGGRYGYGQVLLASGHLVVLTEGGDLALVRATPDRHQELARFPALTGKTWNHPVIAGGYLLVRNLAEMAAFDLRAPAR